jgi:hypothetical protein
MVLSHRFRLVICGLAGLRSTALRLNMNSLRNKDGTFPGNDMQLQCDKHSWQRSGNWPIRFMSIFTKRRAETEFDRKAQALFEHRVTPTQALLGSTVVFLCCLYCFAVALLGWPKGLARQLYAVCLFVPPGLGFVCIREIWRSGWRFRWLLAASLSLGAFLLWCSTTYLVIHPRAANHSMQRTGTSRPARFLLVAKWPLAPAADR